MPITPVTYAFHGMHPCVKICADGLNLADPQDRLVCLIDFRSGSNYELLLYPSAVARIAFSYRSYRNVICLPDETFAWVQAAYLGVDWWNTNSWLRTHYLPGNTNLPNPHRVDGYVSLDYFTIRKIEISPSLGNTTVT